MSTHVIVDNIRRRRRLPPPSARRRLRERAGLSQAALAQAIGVTDTTVSRWESGERFPRDAALERYLEVLDVIADEVAK